MTFISDMPVRFVYVRLQIDTNRVNSRSAIPAMNRIEQRQRDGVVELLTSYVAFREMKHGANPALMRRIEGMIFSFTAADTQAEAEEMRRIETILHPLGARTASERNDVRLCFNASKYRGTLVSNGGGSRRQPRGILRCAQALRSQLGIRVMRDTEAVACVEVKIRERDELARDVSRETGASLPTWVGRD